MPPTIPALRFRPFTEQDAVAVASWRYPGPYAAYDLDPGNADVLAALLHPDHQYHAMLREGELVGFFCLGEDARVSGWSYDDSAVDLGMGLRPDLTGKGNGSRYLDATLSYLDRHSCRADVRATIASWNRRAIRLCRRAGFQEIARFSNAIQNYIVLLRAEHL